MSYVAGISEWARRVRELRTEFGWPVKTQFTGRPDLKAGMYILESDRQAPVHDRRIPDPIRAKVLVRKAWARLIAKIYETNPLLCPHCGSEMKIVKFVEQEQDIRSMLALLGIPYQPRGQPELDDQLINQDYVVLPDGEPFYDED